MPLFHQITLCLPITSHWKKPAANRRVIKRQHVPFIRLASISKNKPTHLGWILTGLLS